MILKKLFAFKKTPTNRTEKILETSIIEPTSKSSIVKTEIIRITSVLLTVFIAFSIFINYGLSANGEIQEVKQQLEKEHLRSIAVEGTFYSNNGTAITKGNEVCYPELYSHIIGYNNAMYGSTGLKDTMSCYLYEKLNEENIGCNINLTIDHNVQKYAYDTILKDQIGAVVVLDNHSGAVRVLASQSEIDYDVNDLKTSFGEARKYEGSLLDNATTAAVPGSIFKAFTAACALEKTTDSEFYEYYDDGGFEVEGFTIRNAGNASYGQIDLQDGIVNSVNSYFAQLGIKIGNGQLSSMAEKFLLNKRIELEFCTLTSIFDTNNGEPGLVAQSSYGQGNDFVSPLQIAMIYQAFASGNGAIYEPYVVNEVTSADGDLEYRHEEKILAESVISENTAQKLSECLEAAADNYGFINDNYKVHAKTGTAETPISGVYNCWIAGYTDEYTFVVMRKDLTSSSQLKNCTKSLLDYLYMNTR